MSENKKFLEGCEKLADGRYRIREKMTVIPIKSKEPITEKIIVEGKEYSPKRKYTFLVWNDDFNGNGRSYKYVIDRVIKENRPTFTLADHPQDGCEADSLRITGCGKNYRKLNDWLATDWYPLGEIGNRIADGFDLGVPATISSSVLGELDDEGYVKNNESFFLERILDNLIEFPSNGIFHYQDHVDKMGDDNYNFTTISNEGLNESRNKTSSSLKEDENITIIDNIDNVESSEKPQNDKSDELDNNVKGENIMPENTNDELVQQSMILNIKSMIKDADKIESPFERKDALVSADCFAQKLTDKTIHDEISKKIEDTENEIKELSKKGLQTDDLAEKVKSLEDENATLKTELDALKKEKSETDCKLKTITDMYEDEQFKASETEIEKTDELTEKNHRLSRELASLKAKNRKLEFVMKREKKISEAKIKKLDAEANTMVDAETVIAYQDEIKSLKAKISKLEDELDTCNKAKKALEAEANTTVDTEDVVALNEKINSLVAKNNALVSKNARLMRSLNEARMEKKATRFSSLMKNLEDDENVVTDEIVNKEVNDEDIAIENGEVVVAEQERDEDEIMEKLLHGGR